jgi:hypothetical protein
LPGSLKDIQVAASSIFLKEEAAIFFAGTSIVRMRHQLPGKFDAMRVQA